MKLYESNGRAYWEDKVSTTVIPTYELLPWGCSIDETQESYPATIEALEGNQFLVHISETCEKTLTQQEWDLLKKN